MFMKVEVLVELSQNFRKWLNQTFFFNKAEISYFYTSHIKWSNTIVFVFVFLTIHLQKLNFLFLMGAEFFVYLAC